MRFELNEREKESAEIFEKKHLNCAKKHPSTIGGAVTYCFTPTGVGLSISIKCNVCNKEKDITDYESW
jgi:hypothetical protein